MIFDIDIGVTEINLIDAKCNLNYIVEKYLKDMPTVIKSRKFLKCTSTRILNNPTVVITLKK